MIDLHGNELWKLYARRTGGGGVQLGSELITNGDFATDTVWVKGSGWLISGVANTDGSNGDLTQTVAITSGVTYRLTFDIVAETSSVSGLHIRLGSSGNQAAFSGVGSKSTNIVAGASAPTLQFWVDPASSFVGQIDNVSLKEIL